MMLTIKYIPVAVSFSSSIKYWMVHLISNGLIRDVQTLKSIMKNTNMHYPNETPINDFNNPLF